MRRPGRNADLFLLLIAAGLIAAATWPTLTINRQVVLADRPRTKMDPPDYTMKFLQATGLKSSSTHGFVVLDASEETQKNLYLLLRGLATYQNIHFENLGRLQDRDANAVFRCQPDAQGVLQVVSLPKDQVTLSDERMLGASLRQQYVTVLRALEAFGSHVAGAPLRDSLESIVPEPPALPKLQATLIPSRLSEPPTQPIETTDY